MSFREYVEHGWKLCSIREREKRPRGDGWNKRENAITDPTRAGYLEGAGLLHAFSGTCAIDIDHMDMARVWFRERGSDMDALFKADDALQITRGDASRGKLIYSLPEPLRSQVMANPALLPTKQIKNDDKTLMLLEFRCGAATGNSVQDVLPPTIHPSGKRYEWKFGELIDDWRYVPELPKPLLDLWLSMVGPVDSRADSAAPRTESPANLSELRLLLDQEDPDVTHDEWVKIGMGLHHETGGSEEGLALWDEWSAKGSKYNGHEELEYKWRSFRDDHPNPVTLGSLLRKRRARDVDFPPPSNDVRLVISLDGGKLDENAKRCEEILSDELYVRDHALVRVGSAWELDPSRAWEIRRVDAQPVVMSVSIEYLQRRLTERVRFERYDGRSKTYVPKDCPKGLAAAIGKYGEWPKMRELRSIAAAPFMRPDKTVCNEPGYDERSRTFYAPNADFPTIPEFLAREDAARALGTLLAPFAEFPFADAAHRSAFASHILTEAVRLAIETSPIYAYTAPEAGTGKSLLSEMPASIVHGMTPAMRAWAADGDELRKVLFASLLAGDRTIGFDNVPSGTKVYAAELCRFATSVKYSDRKLGVSETASMPNTAVAFLTGNNLTPAGDLARRSIVVRLDANVESRALRERQFSIDDLRGHVRAHRAELLVAALTIVRAFVIADAPAQSRPLPSFEQWSRLVRDPLIWLGLPDPVLTQDQETDNDAAPLAAVFDAIARWRGDQWFQSSELHAEVTFGGSSCDQLRGALIAASCNVHDARHIGMWLRGHRGRKVGDAKLEDGTMTRDGRGGVRGWRLAGAEALDLI